MQDITKARTLAAFVEAMAPIAPFLEDDAITNIMMNPPDTGATSGCVFVKSRGKMLRTDRRVEVSDAVKMLGRAANAHRLPLNEQHPELSCRAGLYRLEGSIAPIVKGAAFSVRKHTHSNRSLEDYVTANEISHENYEVLLHALKARQNILVGGATDSGKTTLLNALVKAISQQGRRILTIENEEELLRPDDLAIQMYTSDYFSTRDAVRAAMRHTPERIVVGEIRDGSAALEALKAWRTGHPGLATVHAGNTQEMLERIWDLCEEEKPTRPQMIARVIKLCVHIDCIGDTRSIQIDRVLGWHQQHEYFLLEPANEKKAERQ